MHFTVIVLALLKAEFCKITIGAIDIVSVTESTKAPFACVRHQNGRNGRIYFYFN